MSITTRTGVRSRVGCSRCARPTPRGLVLGCSGVMGRGHARGTVRVGGTCRATQASAELHGWHGEGCVELRGAGSSAGCMHACIPPTRRPRTSSSKCCRTQTNGDRSSEPGTCRTPGASTDRRPWHSRGPGPRPRRWPEAPNWTQHPMTMVAKHGASPGACRAVNG